MHRERTDISAEIMTSKAAIRFRVVLVLLIGVSFSTTAFSALPRLFCPVATTQLAALPPSQSAGHAGGTSFTKAAQHSSAAWRRAVNHHRHKAFSVPTQSARESAVIVEWEPMTELERRIEDGIHYDHMRQCQNQGEETHSFAENGSKREETNPSTRAVFCGYRFSQDEYSRLKSANIS